MDLSDNFNNIVNRAFTIVDSNKIVYTVIGLFLVLYAAIVAPTLPISITKYFKNTWFKLAFMFLIGYLATKNASVAIISAIALLVTLQTLSSQETKNTIIGTVGQEDDMRKDFNENGNNINGVVNENLYELFESKPAPTTANIKIILPKTVLPARKSRVYNESNIVAVTKWTKEKYPKMSDSDARKLAIRTLNISNHSLGYLGGNKKARSDWAIAVRKAANKAALKKAALKKAANKVSTEESKSMKLIKLPTKKLSKAATKKVTTTPTKKVTTTPTKKVTKIPTKKVTKTPTKKVTKTPTKKVTKKPTKKVTKTPTNLAGLNRLTNVVTNAVTNGVTNAVTNLVINEGVAPVTNAEILKENFSCQNASIVIDGFNENDFATF